VKSFKSKQLNPALQYKLMSGAIIPRPIAWVTTQSASGVVNAAPFSFFNVVATGIPLVSIAIMRGADSKDTARNILETHEAVIHLVNPDNVEQMNQTAATLPSNISELDSFDIEMVASETVKTPSIQNTAIRFETTLFKHIPIETQGIILTDLMILEIKNFVFDDRVIDLEKAYIKPDELQPIARLAGNDYTGLGEIFTIERPM
jgi:flavin reductase (DIM6/NTAB) family NADH-FMN oxidoreductase RutF